MPELPSTLLLEAGRETAGGREVQLPLECLAEFFGISREDTYYMTLGHGDGSVERNRPLAIYSQNSTFRISSSKFLAIPQDQRPMIVRLDRTDEDTFDVTLIRRDTTAFRDAEAHLNRGGGGTKRWGVIA